jgi:hypothetical protein
VPNYTITVDELEPFRTWGLSGERAASWYARQVHGADSFAVPEPGERGLRGEFWPYAPTARPGQFSRVGEPFNVGEDG